ncbi:hypothetical protein RUND412_000415 [Rhizina undulata]
MNYTIQFYSIQLNFPTFTSYTKAYTTAMTIFFVYMRWHRETHSDTSRLGRILLTCESRYIADEFFRALQTVQGSDGRLLYSLMDRKTPDLWYYDTPNDNRWDQIVNILGTPGLLSQFKPTVMVMLMNDWGGRDWPVIPAVSGPDYVHNGTFFIRNKRQPNLYWYSFEGSIRVSDRQKTKFRIGSSTIEQSLQKIMIRDEEVEIRTLDNRSNPSYVTRGSNGSSVLQVCSDTSERWPFRNFQGRFGTTWEDRGHGVQEFVRYTEGEDGDEWELC